MTFPLLFCMFKSLSVRDKSKIPSPQTITNWLMALSWSRKFPTNCSAERDLWNVKLDYKMKFLFTVFLSSVQKCLLLASAKKQRIKGVLLFILFFLLFKIVTTKSLSDSRTKKKKKNRSGSLYLCLLVECMNLSFKNVPIALQLHLSKMLRNNKRNSPRLKNCCQKSWSNNKQRMSECIISLTVLPCFVLFLVW